MNKVPFGRVAAMAIVLSLNMLVLWAYSGAARGKTKTTPTTRMRVMTRVWRISVMSAATKFEAL